MSSIALFQRLGLACALIPLCLAAPAGAQESAAPAVVNAAQPQEATSVFGEPLFVNGKRISDLAIKRFLCYGKGRNGLESLRLGLLMDQERELRHIKARERMLEENYGGKALADLTDAQRAELEQAIDAEMARFQIDPEEFEVKLAGEMKTFAERYPTLDLDTEIRRAYQSVDWWKDQIRMTLEFDQLFFPGHPDTWPDLSLEAIHQASPQFDLVADYKKYYEMRSEEWLKQRAAAREEALAQHFDGATVDSLTEEQKAQLEDMVDEVAGKFMPREEDMMMALLRDAVQAILGGFVTIKTASDGLPEELLMTIEGNGLTASLTTEQVYQDMKSAFDEHDIYEAKLFLALMEAAKDKLAEEGVLKPEGPFREKQAKEKADTANMGTFGSFNFVATNAFRFPSVESYEDYNYLYDSFRDSIQASLQPDADGNLPPELAAHFPIVQGIMGIARVQSENLLVSAFDFPRNEWKENGWENAYERALSLRAEIDAYVDKLAAQEEARAKAEANGEAFEPEEVLLPFDQWWANFLDLNSDFWDPPLPAVGKSPPANSMRDKGRFQGTPTTRNDLKGYLGESPYSHFLWDANAVDSIFFDVPKGAVGGPFRGPQGYIITYVKDKVGPTKTLSLRDERTLQALQEDYTQLAFRRFCHDALNAADVSGLD
ncbi:MAG: hypothetical protein H6830_05785 [Planctomycetes bacterium]|nr:hypothetical protein [Planctomycetota bacterium]MCB9909033.1 hypothetical protein [Planctomycetota bacterium]MCB9911722.1 hypothetical protein [Planctomycetota bacterium]HPF14139.1 hypothetical protein [Planctomycetota bacterium]